MTENNELNIELNSQTAKGEYSNMSIITHSSNEFVVDFLELLPGLPKAQVVSRIIITPENVKRLNNALKENIKKFEEKFGEIILHEPENISQIPIGINHNSSNN